MASEVFERCGLKVLYGDTDSCMIGGTEVTRLVYNGDVRAHYEVAGEMLRRSIQATPFKSMDMSFESYHPRIMFLGKKKYCKLNEDGRVTYKGVSVVRSDTLGISKHCFTTVSSILLFNSDTNVIRDRIAEYISRVLEVAYCSAFTAWDVSKVRKVDGRKCYVYTNSRNEEKSVPIDMAVNTVTDYSTSAVLRVFRKEMLGMCKACGLGDLEDIMLKSNTFI